TQSVGNEILQRSNQKTDPNSKGTTGSSSLIIDQKNSTGGTDQTKVTISTVDKLNTGDKADKPPTHDPPPVTLLPEHQQTINYAPLFLSGGTLTRVALPSNSTNGAVHAIAPDVSADGRYVAFFSASQRPDAGGDSSKFGGDVYLYDRQTNTTTTI